MPDPFDLERFVRAQQPIFEQVLHELGRGQKVGHWMWFVFPQIRGLGHSDTARHFGLSSRQEAEAYLRHPVLGPRLEQCVRLLLRIEGRSLAQIFGYPDDLKFKSCMTLFAAAAPGDPLFADALEKYCGGQRDLRTLERLERA